MQYIYVPRLVGFGCSDLLPLL